MADSSGRAFDEGGLPALDFATLSRPVAAPKAEHEPESGKPQGPGKVVTVSDLGGLE